MITEQRQQVFCQYVKTPGKTMAKLQALGTLQPNTKTVTLKISRNIKLADFQDSVQYFELPEDEGNPATRYYLFDTQATVTDWLLTLVSIPDFNQEVQQSTQPNSPVVA